MSILKLVLSGACAAAVVSALAVAVAPQKSFAEDTKMVGGAAMYPTKNIIENAVNSKDHTTLVAAVKAAGLVDTLSGPGPFTVFAPTNEAFEMLPKGTVESLLKPENKDKLVKILTYHVVKADALAPAIRKMVKDEGGRHMVTTVAGNKLAITVKDSQIMLEDESGGTATVTIQDVKQSNGVIHVIDRVLLPK